MDHLPLPWLRPTAVDPDLLVNRSAELKKYGRILGEYAEDADPNALLLLRGDRGVGKSIFGRRLVADLKAALPSRVLAIVLDHRGADERAVLRRFIDSFVQGAPAVLGEDPRWRAEWLGPLQELYGAGDRMVRSVAEGTGREYGAASEVSGGLWGVLQGKFGASWKQKVDLTRRTDFTIEVTEELLRAALIATLDAVKGHAAVVVFFDDLDQARRIDSAEGAKGTLRAILDLRPCIKLVHLRSEYGFADWRREVDVTIDLDGLPESELRALLRRRAERDGGHQRVLSAGASWAPLDRLAHATTNPLVLLRWAQALIAEADTWPPPVGWTAPERLRRMVLKSLNGPDADLELLTRLGRVLDRLDRNRGFSEDDLIRGCRELDAAPVTDRVDAAEVAWLRQYELIVAVNREDPAAGLRADPLLDLTRPSVAARLGK